MCRKFAKFFKFFRFTGAVYRIKGLAAPNPYKVKVKGRRLWRQWRRRQCAATKVVNVANVRNVAVVIGSFLQRLQRLVDVKLRRGYPSPAHKRYP